MQDRGGGDADERAFEDVGPRPVCGVRDVAPGALERVWGQGGVVAGGGVGREAKLVYDVGRAEERVRVCEAVADVCARTEGPVDL